MDSDSDFIVEDDDLKSLSMDVSMNMMNNCMEQPQTCFLARHG